MKNYYNVVIVGKTGVGKSSFINYLFGANRMKTGVGEPVTQRGFESIETLINDLPVRLFDSWGLEADKADQWMSDLEKELNNRNYNQALEEWFHTIFYCISAGGSRVEDYDMKIIKMFLEKKYKVNVILTKVDQASVKDIEAMEKAIKDDLKKSNMEEGSVEIPIIPIISEEKELRGGRKITRMGKKEVEKAIADGFWTSVTKRVPEMCIATLSGKIETWKKEQVCYINKKLNRWKRKEIEDTLKKEVNKFISELNTKIISDSINKDIKNAINYFSEIYSSLFPEVSYNFKLSKLKNRVTNENVTFGDYLSALNFFNLNYFRDKWYGDKLKEELESIKNEMINNIIKIKPQIEDYINNLNQEKQVI